MNFLDRALSVVAPRAALRREAARRMLQAIRSQSYEAASLAGRTSGWVSAGSGPNDTTYGELDVLRARMRDLVRNNTHAGKAVRVRMNYTVGSGIVATVAGRSESLRRRVDGLWSEVSQGTELDPERRLTFGGMQRQWVRAVEEAGEVLIRRRIRRDSDGLRVPLQFQTLEAEHLDTQRNTLPRPGDAPGNRVVQGVEYDALGRRVAYWLYPQHPLEYRLGGIPQSVRVPASEVIHLFDPKRPGQARGVPRASSAIVVLHDWSEYTDAHLVAKKVANLFAGFIHDIDPAMAMDAGLPGALSSAAKAPDGNPEINPGAMVPLPAGKSVTFTTPPKVEGFREFTQVTLLDVASAFHVTYEELTGDLSNVNFTSARMGRLSMLQDVDAFRDLVLIPQALTPCHRWFLQAAELSGALPDTRGLSVVWTPPRRESVDPGKEARATKDTIRAGLQSLSAAIRARGEDPDQVLEELADDRERAQELGLSLDVFASAPESEVGSDGDQPTVPDADDATATTGNAATAAS